MGVGDDACERAAEAVLDRIHAPIRRDAAYRDAVAAGLNASEVARRVRAILRKAGVRENVLRRQGVSHDSVTRAVASQRQ